MPPVVFGKKNDILHTLQPFCFMGKRKGGGGFSLDVGGGGAAPHNLGVGSGKKVAVCAPKACERGHCTFCFRGLKYKKGQTTW